MMKCENDNSWLLWIVVINSIWISTTLLTKGSTGGIDIIGGMMDIVYSIRYNLLMFFALLGMTSFMVYLWSRNIIYLSFIGLMSAMLLVTSYNMCFDCIYNDIIGLIKI